MARAAYPRHGGAGKLGSLGSRGLDAHDREAIWRQVRAMEAWLVTEEGCDCDPVCVMRGDRVP
jgi:hypothetical protein